MIPVLSLGLAAMMGAHWSRLLVLGAAVYQPLPTLLLVAVVIWKVRSRTSTKAALFCDVVAAELRAGSSLRDSAATAASAAGTGPIDVTGPVPKVAARLREEFPEVGDGLAMTFRGAVRAGNDPAALFDEISAFALAKAEIESEIRVATSPAIATAVLLIGAPLVFVLFQAESGALGRVLASPGQRMAGLIGLGMFGLGLIVASLVLWRTRP